LYFQNDIEICGAKFDVEWTAPFKWMNVLRTTKYLITLLSKCVVKIKFPNITIMTTKIY